MGPYKGHLSNNGETIAVSKPDPPQTAAHPDAGFVPYVLVERIDYLSVSSWPDGADGTGLALQRRVASDFGNEPANSDRRSPNPGPL